VTGCARTLFVGLGAGLLTGCALLVSFSGLDDGGGADASGFEGSSRDATQTQEASEPPESAGPSDAGQRAEAGDAGPMYLGCFSDSSQNRDLPYKAYDSVYSTVDSCVAACTYYGYLYAGLQDGIQCFCGNSYGSHGTSGNCTVPCAGNSAETCGGAYANSVYRTSVQGE
jgi:hypothetical protein